MAAPSEENIEKLLQMGISRNIAVNALILAENNVENAANLIFTIGDEEISRQVEQKSIEKSSSEKKHTESHGEDSETDGDYTDSDDEDYPDKDYKMQILVRSDLQMGKGKIAGQCCHGCLGVVRLIESSDNETWKKYLRDWIKILEAKVILKVPDEKTLMEYYNKANALGYPVVYIEDAGRTQIEPGSKTVVAIGPLPVEDFEFTKNLKLL